jgi:hypothetical protein
MGPRMNAFSALSTPQEEQAGALPPPGEDKRARHAIALQQERSEFMHPAFISPDRKRAMADRLAPSGLLANSKQPQGNDQRHSPSSRPAFKPTRDNQAIGRPIASQWVRPDATKQPSGQKPSLHFPTPAEQVATPRTHPLGQPTGAQWLRKPLHSGKNAFGALPTQSHVPEPQQFDLSAPDTDAGAKPGSPALEATVGVVGTEPPLGSTAATASAADAMRAAAQGRKLREAEAAHQDQEAWEEDRQRRLQYVDPAVAATVVSESELRRTCAALEVGRLMAPLSRAAPRVAVVFSEELRKDGQSMQQLVRTFDWSPMALTPCRCHRHVYEQVSFFSFVLFPFRSVLQTGFFWDARAGGCLESHNTTSGCGVFRGAAQRRSKHGTAGAHLRLVANGTDPMQVSSARV